MTSLVPPSDPGQDPRPFYRALVEAIAALQRPGQPTPAFSTTSTDALRAADWAASVVYFTDLKVLAVSDGTAWIRQDTGAPI